MAAFTVACQVAFSSWWIHSAIAQLLKSGRNGRLERLVFFGAITEPRVVQEQWRAVVQFDVTVKLWNILYIPWLRGVYQQYEPSPLDICPQLRLGQISWGSGLILLIHTSKPWYIYYIIYHLQVRNVKGTPAKVFRQNTSSTSLPPLPPSPPSKGFSLPIFKLANSGCNVTFTICVKVPQIQLHGDGDADSFELNNSNSLRASETRPKSNSFICPERTENRKKIITETNY